MLIEWLGRLMRDKKAVKDAKAARDAARAELDKRRADKRPVVDKLRDRLRQHHSRDKPPG